jgi:cysteine-rich repeat protein
LWTCTGRPSVCIYNGPPVCGNGRVESGEECDDRNTVNNDGCNSRCKREVASNNDATKGFTLVGRVAANINSVFVVLKTDQVYNFDNEKEQENFIKTSFPGSTVIPTVYCTQKNAPEKDIFDCYILYNSGVPNKKFNIEFSYNF